jgi:hypothetical protein
LRQTAHRVVRYSAAAAPFEPGRWHDFRPPTTQSNRKRRLNANRRHRDPDSSGNRPKHFALAGGPGATLGWCRERCREPALAGGKTSTKNTNAFLRDLSLFKSVHAQHELAPCPMTNRPPSFPVSAAAGTLAAAKKNRREHNDTDHHFALRIAFASVTRCASALMTGMWRLTTLQGARDHPTMPTSARWT